MYYSEDVSKINCKSATAFDITLERDIIYFYYYSKKTGFFIVDSTAASTFSHLLPTLQASE